MIELLEQMNGWHWLAFGLALLAFELLGTAGYLLWLGISAVLVGLIMSFMPLSWSVQWLTFVVFSLFTTWLWWRYQHRQDRAEDKHRTLNRRTEQLVGQICILDQPVPVGPGRMKLGDTTWAVRSDVEIDAGTLVEVIAVDGITLVIRPKLKGSSQP
ncbi:NfeD family protein [Photobacterium sp.]|uniref:NfeD family protein n=1 Tax=Photobacterium sp. TaxID=660 RepID=UPI00299F2183|nr:NfeD family protein [Photobacterium sp.]MDX1301518.1 NfeD family protein [Photobacterium sp.]